MSRRDYSARARLVPEKSGGKSGRGKIFKEKTPALIREIIAKVRKEEEEARCREPKPEINHSAPAPDIPADALGALVSERLLGDSQLAWLLMQYSENFQSLDKSAFYGWLRPNFSEGDYLVMASEISGKRGRLMRLALIGLRERTRKEIMIEIGTGIGMRMLDRAAEVYGGKLEQYRKTYQELRNLPDKILLI